MYGSILSIVTFRPRLSRSAPRDADASPLPSDDTTPPVTKMNLVLAFFALNADPPPSTVPVRDPPLYPPRGAHCQLRSSGCASRTRARGVVRALRRIRARPAAPR